MKVVSNNKFRDKLTFLDNESTIKVKNFINLIDSFKKSKSLVDQSNTHNSNIYEYVLDDLKIFYTIESDYSGDETIILMDILKPTIKLGFSFKNPRTNTIYNPRTNTLINPRTNTLINPRTNTLINPRTNTLINPRTNTLINPRTNTLINPRTNTLINPRTNTLINPRTNTLMNPSLNPSFNGRIIYNLDLDPIEFYVKASENFIVIFNYNYDFIKFGVKHSQKGYIIFDLNNNEMLEHYESNGQEGYNVFNDNNDWIGLVI
jgi:hypothetical protein